ncbi:CLUMA_CG006004, isoform A [Clunio marinus]|uniref:CLUMA_CG006004, isoform A n=1 Tax=Clunio marinus TaxID=568069 RepID=A0A1J1HWP5_9DIPT|nr:CLUMA_CG006004, isoform A [Clunio marinus]
MVNDNYVCRYVNNIKIVNNRNASDFRSTKKTNLSLYNVYALLISDSRSANIKRVNFCLRMKSWIVLLIFISRGHGSLLSGFEGKRKVKVSEKNFNALLGNVVCDYRSTAKNIEEIQGKKLDEMVKILHSFSIQMSSSILDTEYIEMKSSIDCGETFQLCYSLKSYLKRCSYRILHLGEAVKTITNYFQIAIKKCEFVVKKQRCKKKT